MLDHIPADAPTAQTILQKIIRNAGDDGPTALALIETLADQGRDWVNARKSHTTWGKRGHLAPAVPAGTALTVARDNFDEWGGTFALLLEAVVNDLLSDGEGFAGAVVWQDDESDGRNLTTGYIVGIDENQIHFFDDGVVEREHILALGVR